MEVFVAIATAVGAVAAVVGAWIGLATYLERRSERPTSPLSTKALTKPARQPEADTQEGA